MWISWWAHSVFLHVQPFLIKSSVWVLQDPMFLSEEHWWQWSGRGHLHRTWILICGLNSYPTEYAWRLRTIQIQSVWMSALGLLWDTLLRVQCIWAFWIKGEAVWFCCPYSRVRNKEIYCWNIYIKWTNRPGWRLSHCRWISSLLTNLMEFWERISTSGYDRLRQLSSQKTNTNPWHSRKPNCLMMQKQVETERQLGMCAHLEEEARELYQ